MSEKKAGCIVLSDERPGEAVIIYRKKDDDFSFPKGKVEKGETSKECALRETEEEIGLKVSLVKKFGTVSYIGRSGKKIKAKYYIAKVNGEVKFNPEKGVAPKWEKISKIKKKLTCKAMKKLYKENKFKLSV